MHLEIKDRHLRALLVWFWSLGCFSHYKISCVWIFTLQSYSIWSVSFLYRRAMNEGIIASMKLLKLCHTLTYIIDNVEICSSF